MASLRNASVLQKLFGAQKDRAARRSAIKGRLLRMETLEDRSLLTASVGIVATDASVCENSTSDVGSWRIERAESSSSPLLVSFKLSGTATWNADYRLYNLTTASYLTPNSVYNQTFGEYELVGEATIPGGSTTLDLELRPLSDALQESTGNATITLLASSVYNIVDGEASIELVDANSWYVDVSSNDANASEAPTSTSDYATFTVSRNGSLNLSTALTVRFEVGGSATPNSDYSLYNASSQVVSLSQVSGSDKYFGHVQIPAGQTTATIQLRPNNDSIWESTETATFEVVANPAYFYNVGAGSIATATIADNDDWTLNVAALDSEGAETGYGATSNPLVFRISRVGETDLSKSTTVWFGLNGSASFSSDYNLSGGSYNVSNGYGTATIPANASHVDLTLNVVDDAILESTETVGVFLLNKPTGASVSYSDYSLGADFFATGTILDDDGWTIEVAATDADGSETISGATPDPVVFTLTRSGETNLSKPTTVYYRLSGSASYSTSYSSSDYSISGGNYNTTSNYGTATIPANSASTTITLNPYNDAYYEDAETVVLTILNQSPNNLSTPLTFQYGVGENQSATATISDNDRWTIEVAATDGAGAETASGTTANPIVFTLTRSGATDLAQTTTVYYELTGAAIPGTDYSVANGTFSTPYGCLSIPSNATSATLTLNAIDDYLIEDRESVVLRILDSVPSAFNYYNSNVQYGLGTNRSASAFIDDNENRVVVEIAALDPLARETPSGEPSDGGTFRISRTGDATSALTVYYATSGTSTNGSDFSNLYGTATIPAGSNYVDVAITPLNDSAKESTETIVATLYVQENYYYYGSELPYVLGAASSATVYLLDDDRDPTGGPYVVPENGSAQLSAFASLEAAGWSVDWDLDGDGAYGETGLDATRGDETGSDAAFRAFGTTATDPPQSYSISVRLSKGETSYVATTSATIQNVAPQISLTTPNSIAPGASATISGSFVDPGSDAWSGTILFGDETSGASPTSLVLNSSNKTFSVSHTYSTSGWFDVVVSIDDGKETSTTTRRVKVGSPAAVEISPEGSAIPLVSGSSSIALKSFDKNENGENVDPQTGETVFQRFRVRNLGSDTLTFDASTISVPSNVALVGSFPTSLAPDEERFFTVKWTARGTLAGTISIPTSDSVVPIFSVALTGSVATYSAPTLDGIALLYDSGDDATDKISFNPILTGTVFGEFARGRVEIEFDVDSDSLKDGSSRLYDSGRSFEFDPRTVDSSWPRPTSGSSNVSVRYRLVHYDDLGAVLSTGSWNAFNYTIIPEPVGTLTVSNMNVSAGLDGDWTRPGSVVLNGSLDGSVTRRIEIVAGSNSVIQTVAASTFSVSLPFGFEYGGATTIQARVGVYDSTYKTDVYGAWTSLSITPQLPAVSSLTFQTNSETGPALVGTLAAGIGRNFREVVISCGDNTLGSAWTDENGSFTFVPKGLPIVDGDATETVTARAVYRPTAGTPVFGTSASTTATYSPASTYAYLTTNLVEPGTNSSTTSNPSFKVAGSFASKLDVAFEYRWKLSTDSDWSTAKFVLGTLDDELNVDDEATNLYWSGTFSIAELYDINSDSASVSVQTRPLFYDEIVGDYVATSSWSSFSTTFVRPTFSVASVSSVALANPTDGLGFASSDPTISGTISSSGTLGGIAVKFYLGDVCVGRTTTDSNGAFSFTPTGLTLGQVQLSVAASQWNPTTREYQSGTSQTVSFEYVATSVAAPLLESLRLADDTGVDGDGTTANATIRGRLDDSDGESVVNLLVEYDVDGDGAPDGWTRTDASGEFYFTPELSPGAHTVRVRATRWDSVAGTEVAGVWQSVALTLAVPTNPAAPVIREFSPSTYLLNSQGIKTTYSANVFGVASSETGFDDVRVEYEILSGGSGTHTANVSPLGEFCWTPTLTVPESGETNVSIRARVGRWSATTNATVWGAWTNLTFVYRAATESVLLAWKNETSDRADASYYERKISGSVAPGEGVVSYCVEFDVDGDGTADGQTTPNSKNDFSYCVEPTRPTLYARVVDELADGTTRVSSQGWQTISTSYYNNFESANETTLALYFVDAVDYEPYLQVGNYVETYSNLTISLDYDYDGAADAFVSPDARGQISRSAIVAALAGRDVAIRDGFSVVYAWLNDQSADETAKVPVPLLTSTAASEVARFESFIASIATILDYDPTEAPDSSEPDSSTSREFDYQTTPEPTTSSTTASLNVGAQSDWDVLRNSPIPAIAFPTLDGEAVDLSRDVALRQALDDVSDAYDAAVRAAQNAWTSTYRALRDAYDAAVDAAWNDYSREYSRNAAEFSALQAQTWENSDENRALYITYQQELNAINEQKVAKTAEINARYSADMAALNDAYLAGRCNGDDDGCSGSYHTEACQRRQLQNDERYQKANIAANAQAARRVLALNAETQILSLQAQARRDSALANAKKTFETDRNDRLAELATSAAERGAAYETAVANALYAFYAGGESGGLAGADETYQNAIATAAQAATTASWNAVRSAVTAWKNATSTPADWGSYVDSLYALSQTRALAESSACVAQVQASAAAQKTADVAAAGAYRAYLTSSATTTCVAWRGNISSVQALQNAVANATAANEIATSELVSREFVSQYETSLSTRLANAQECQNVAEECVAIWRVYFDALVGVTDGDAIDATVQAMNAAINAQWFAYAKSTVTVEGALYETLIDSGETIQSGRFEIGRNLQTSLWSALGTYWKAEIATSANKAIATEIAENVCATTFETAEKTLTLAQLAADSNCAAAQITAEQARLIGEKTLTQTTTQSLFGAYFTSLTTACGEMANECVGDYYASAVAAVQTAFNAQNAADSSLESSLISKAAAYASASLGLETLYATSYTNALYDYFATQNDSNAAALNRTKARDQAEIDARVAYYCAVENANCAKDVAAVEANADALRRKLALLVSWCDYVADFTWNSVDPENNPYVYSSANYYSTELPTTSELPTFGDWSNNVPTRFAEFWIPGLDNVGVFHTATIWNGFAALNETIVSMQTKSAELDCDAALANGYDAETRAALDAAGIKLASDLSAEAALGVALRSAQGTAYSGYLTATRNADSTSNVLNYVNANVGAQATYASSIASAYGDFQIANRQNKLNGTTASNPRRPAYAADVTWAQQTKSLRNQYYAKSGTAASDYCATIANALATYDAAALNAELTAAQNYFNAAKTFSQNAQNAYNDYVLADFEAAKAQAPAYLTASISQLTDNYAKEAELAQTRADAYSDLLDAQLANLAATDLSYFAVISSLKDAFAEASATALANDATIAASNETELSTEKSENEAEYNDAKSEADATYQKAWQDAWNDAFLETLGEAATEKTDVDAITAAMQTALETANATYRAAAFAAYEDFSDETLDLAKIYAYNQARIDHGGTVATNAFENPTFDYEVCFVAGTQILMADGSTKPIEQIRPGDKVLAADHLNLEEKPTAANVVRFFDNGEKEVVKLSFENDQEIVCTPGHRFYVIKKGWIHAQDLQQGDLCLSATGEKIAFLSRENLPERRRVYNFEVEEKHTYYITNKNFSFLVHNVCPICGVNHLASPSQANVGGAIERFFYWSWGGDQWSQITDCEIYFRSQGFSPEVSAINDLNNYYEERVKTTQEMHKCFTVSRYALRSTNFWVSLADTAYAAATIDKNDRSLNGPIEEYYGWLVDNQGIAYYINDRMTEALSQHEQFNTLRAEIATKLRTGEQISLSKNGNHSVRNDNTAIQLLRMAEDGSIYIVAVDFPIVVSDSNAIRAMIGSFSYSYKIEDIDYQRKTCRINFTAYNSVSNKSSGVFFWKKDSDITVLKQYFIWQETLCF